MSVLIDRLGGIFGTLDLAMDVDAALDATLIPVAQVVAELVALGFIDTVAAAIPGSPTNPINVAWFQGGITQIAGPLMIAIFDAIGYASAAQRTTFITSARLHPY